jgi:hypothetical protein
MSALGHERRFEHTSATSALPLKADILLRRTNGATGPKADVCRRSRGGYKPERAEGTQGIPDLRDLKVNSLFLYFSSVFSQCLTHKAWTADQGAAPGLAVSSRKKSRHYWLVEYHHFGDEGLDVSDVPQTASSCERPKVFFGIALIIRLMIILRKEL